MIHILLCGGAGTRLWPISNSGHPKQLLPLFDDLSLLQLAAQRNQPFCSRVLAVAAEAHAEQVQQQLGQMGVDMQMVREPVGRNTAGAIAIAALVAHEDDVLLITPADHLITVDSRYHQAVLNAKALAEQDWLVTFGLQPLWPETGYGYIQHEGNKVIRFTEKPDLATATSMLAAGNYLWNSGIFCFKASVIIAALRQFVPQVLAAAEVAANEWKAVSQISMATMQAIPSISIDYAVMERSDRVAVVPTNMQWSDVGSFETLASAMGTQSLPAASIGTEGNANNAAIGSKKPVFFVGCSNTMVVESEQAILVLQQGKGQQVKELWEWVKTNRPDLL